MIKRQITTDIGTVTIEEVKTLPDCQSITVMVFKDTGKWYTNFYIGLPVKKNDLDYAAGQTVRDYLENRDFFVNYTLVVMTTVPYMISGGIKND